MKRLLTEAIVSERKKAMQLALLLNEAISNPIFNGAKKFQNELEIDLLFESKRTFQNEIGGTYGAAPGAGYSGYGLRPRPLGPGRFGKATKPLNNLIMALKNAKMDVEDFSAIKLDLENVMSAIDPVIDLLDSEDEPTKTNANILLAKVYIYLKNMLDQVLYANEKLGSMLDSSSFNAQDAKKAMIDAAMKAAQAAKEADEYEARQLSKEKEGFGSKILRGIKKIFGR